MSQTLQRVSGPPSAVGGYAEPQLGMPSCRIDLVADAESGECLPSFSCFSWFFFFMIFQQLQFPACVRSASLRRQTKGVHPLSLYLVILGLLCLISEIWNQKVPLRLHFLDQNNEILKLVVGAGEQGREKPASLKQLWPVYNKAVTLVSVHSDPFLEKDFFPPERFFIIMVSSSSWAPDLEFA